MNKQNRNGLVLGICACICTSSLYAAAPIVGPGSHDEAPIPGDIQIVVKPTKSLQVSVHDAVGNLIPDVSLRFRNDSGKKFKNYPLANGSSVIRMTGGKGVFEIKHAGMETVIREVVLPADVKSNQVSINIVLNGAATRVIVEPLSVNNSTSAVGVPAGIAGNPVVLGGCGLECPAGAVLENEANCGQPDDIVNGGCNLIPALFTDINVGDTICGTAGGDTATRDTDWYRVTTTTDMALTWTYAGDFEALTGPVPTAPQGTGDCADILGVVDPAAFPLACEQVSVTTVCVPAGTYWFFVAPATFDVVTPCGATYLAQLTGTACAIDTGACCFSDATCSDNMTSDECVAAGGTWQGAESECGTLTCPELCGPGAGDCCESNGTPGCEDSACCDTVCAADPFCCDTTWDGICADIAEDLCGATCFVPAPANDLCADAIGPLSAGSSTDGSTAGATMDAAPDCGTEVTAPGVWYTVTGTGNTMTASTCSGASYDTKLSVYCSDCADFTCQDANDDACGLQSEVSWCSQDGAEYLVLVHGFGGAVGDFTLTISDGTACTTDNGCLALGSCCGADGACSITTEADCTAAGGGYQGDGTDCSGATPPQSCDPGTEDSMIMINLITDDFPGETTLEVTDENGDVVFSAGPLVDPATLHTFNIPVCSFGCYTFTIFDAFGDGICCGFGMGSYVVLFDGVVAGSGGEFGDSDSVANMGGCGGGGGGGGCAAGSEDGTITINLTTDDFPGETTLEVTDEGGSVIFSAGPLSDAATLHTFDVPVCNSGCYTVTIFDAFGDGICCGFGTGSYEVLFNGATVGSGGEFADSESVSNIGACGGGGGGCAAGSEDGTITINLTTDDFPGETTLEVTDEGGAVIFSAGPLVDAATLHTFNVPVCNSGCYTFTIFDAFGDGICCGFGTGSYEVLFNGAVVGSGSEFADSESVSNIGDCSGGGGGDCAAGSEDSTLTVNLITDDFPGETTIQVTDGGGSTVFSAGPLTDAATLHTFDIPICSDGCYTFTIFDAFGDGICCGFGTGSYEVLLDGMVVGSGGEFADSESVSDIGGCGMTTLQGTCCVGGSDACVVTTEACCAFANGVFGGAGTECSPITCCDPPVVSCPMDLTVECDGAGNLADFDAWVNSATVSEGCGDVTLTQISAGFMGAFCGATGSTTVTWTAIDSEGQTGECSATFTIVDSTPPVVTCNAEFPIGFANPNNSDDDDDAVLLTYSASDTCGDMVCGSQGVTAVIDVGCGLIPIASGTIVEIKCQPNNCRVVFDGDVLDIKANSPMFIVTATDVCGNVSSCSIDLCEFTQTGYPSEAPTEGGNDKATPVIGSQGSLESIGR